MSKEKSEITLKISAIVIALILWVVVMGIENPDGTWDYKTVEVNFKNMEALEKNGLIIMSPKDAFVSVQVSGRRSDKADFRSEHIKAEVDLSGYSEGERKVPINVSLVTPGTTSNMKVTDWEPKEILFNFDKIITKPKAVTIRTEGNLNPNYVLGEISTKSESILLKGARSRVNQVAEIIADINLTDRKEDINVTVPIKLIDDKDEIVLGVSSEPNIIDVFIPVYRTITVPIEIDTKGELPENYEIGDMEIRPKTIALKGKNSIENLKVILTKKIDINSFMENEEILVELDLPRNVSLLNPDEKITASLKIEEAFTKTFEYKLDEIEVRNLGFGLSVNLEDTTEIIEITFKGDKETIENLSEEDIEVYIDLNMLSEGEHEVYVGYNVPSEITLNEITPQPIKFKLTISD